MAKLKAFISSTMAELHNERAACQRALEQYGIDAIWFEGFGAEPAPASHAYLQEVEEADVYIGIFWHDYSAATRHEYEQAWALDKPCFIYVKTFGRDAPDAQLEELLLLMRGRHTLKKFGTAVDLADLVWRDLHNWLVDEFRSRRHAPELTATRASLEARDVLEVFEENLRDRIAFERALLDMMRDANANAFARPFVSVTELPVFITRPWDVQLKRQQRVFAHDPAALDRVLPMLRERYDLWYEIVAKDQVLLLVDKGAHEQYFAAGKAGQLDFTPDEIEAQISRWIELAENYPNFVVGLQEVPIPTTHFLAGTSTVLLYGGTLQSAKGTPFIGIRGLKTIHPPTVLRFRLAFEQAWLNVPDTDKEREATLRWLRGLVG